MGSGDDSGSRMTPAPIHFAGERVMLDPGGALYWPGGGLLAVSDLHLEKGSSFAQKGMLLPPWDTQNTIDRVCLLLRRWQPRTFVALGNSFHDQAAAGRLPVAQAGRLREIAGSLRFVWVRGNHDPGPVAGLGGESLEVFAAGPFAFRHQARPGSGAGEVCGHHHPKAAIPARGGQVSRPCFVADGRRLMLPAFGAYTGGLDVRDPAIARLFPRGARVFLLGRERLFSFAI